MFFTRVTRTLLQAQTSSSYNDAIQQLKEFVAKKPAKDKRGFLISWLEWWDDRRSHVFPAFARKNALIHFEWKMTGGTHLSLVDAAVEDIKDSVILERQFRGYEAGSFHGGTGPSVFTTTLQSSHAQKNRPEMYVRDLIEGDEPSDLSSLANALSTYQVDPLSLHRATKHKKKKTRTRTKNLNKTSNLSECEDSLASTSDEGEEEEEEEEEEEVLQSDVEDLSAGKRGAKRRVRSSQFNITLK